MAKPVVDGLERELRGRADLFRVDRASPLGQELAGRHGARLVPTLFLFDGLGNLVLLQEGHIDQAEVLSQVGGF